MRDPRSDDAPVSGLHGPGGEALVNHDPAKANPGRGAEMSEMIERVKAAMKPHLGEFISPAKLEAAARAAVEGLISQPTPLMLESLRDSLRIDYGIEEPSDGRLGRFIQSIFAVSLLPD